MDILVKLEPLISLKVNGVGLTPHQLEVIRAIYETGSQKAAAERLGISTPVLHRYLHQIEAKVTQALVVANTRGTVLNAEGEAIAQEFEALKNRLKRKDAIVIGCTIVTEDLLLSTLSGMDKEGRYELIISDDERNMQDFNAHLMDIVVLDDPLYAYESEGVQWEEVAEDRLYHIERGKAYAIYRFGAQRIGFRHLDTQKVEYKIERIEHSISSLMRSNLSYFINESLVLKKGLNLRSSTDPEAFKHKILAMFWEERPEILLAVSEMSKRSLKM